MAKRAAVEETPAELQPISEELPKKVPCDMSQADIDAMTDKHVQFQRTADGIFAKMARGHEMTPQEHTLLQAAGWSNQFDIQAQVGRLAGIHRHQAIAGTAAERDALAAEVAAAESDRDEKLPEIRRELEDTVARLQGQIDKLERAVSGPATKLKTMLAAVENLRNVHMLPTFVKDAYNAVKSRTKGSFADLRRAEGNIVSQTGFRDLIAEAEPFLGTSHRITHNSPVAVFLAMHKLFADSHARTIDAEKFSSFKAKCEADLAAAQEIVSQQAPLYDAKMAAVEKTRDHYVL